MNILIVGGGGYIGIPLAEELESRGHYVEVYDRFFFGKEPKLKTLAQYRDIRSCKIMEGRHDAVIDLAGLSNDASADIDPELTMDINLRGACKLADAAKRAGVRKYIYSSSCSVYGYGDKLGLTEEDECKPLTLYAECKVRVEDHLRSITDDHFKPTILRNATVFGVAPRMRFDLAVNVMTLRAWRDKLIYVMGGGEQRRPFVHIGNVVESFIHALDVPAATYNIGCDGNNVSIVDLAMMVKNNLDAVGEIKIHRIPDDIDKRSYDVSFAKATKVGFDNRKSVSLGIIEVGLALQKGEISGDDPTAYTLQHYKSLLEWDKCLAAIRLDGRIL